MPGMYTGGGWTPRLWAAVPRPLPKDGTAVFVRHVSPRLSPLLAEFHFDTLSFHVKLPNTYVMVLPWWMAESWTEADV